MSGHSKGRHTLSPRSRAKKVGGGAHSPRGGASASPTKGMDEDELLTYITSLTPEQKLTFLATEFFRLRQENEVFKNHLEAEKERHEEWKKSVASSGIREVLSRLEDENAELHSRNQELLDAITMQNARSIMCVTCLSHLDQGQLIFNVLTKKTTPLTTLPPSSGLPIGQGEPFDRQVRLLVQQHIDHRRKAVARAGGVVGNLGLSPRAPPSGLPITPSSGAGAGGAGVAFAKTGAGAVSAGTSSSTTTSSTTYLSPASAAAASASSSPAAAQRSSSSPNSSGNHLSRSSSTPALSAASSESNSANKAAAAAVVADRSHPKMYTPSTSSSNLNIPSTSSSSTATTQTNASPSSPGRQSSNPKSSSPNKTESNSTPSSTTPAVKIAQPPSSAAPSPSPDPPKSVAFVLPPSSASDQESNSSSSLSSSDRSVKKKKKMKRRDS